MQYSEILGLTPRQILVELIRRHSHFDAMGISMDKLVIGPSSVTTEGGRNASLIVSPVPGSGLVNPKTVYYNRIDLSSLGAYGEETHRWPVFVSSSDGIDNISDVLPFVADVYGIVLAKTDIIDAPLETQTYPYVCDVVPTAGNQVWVGKLRLEIYLGSDDLNNIIKNAVLSGLHYLSDDVERVPGPLISHDWFVGEDELLLDGKMPLDGEVLTPGGRYATHLANVLQRNKIGYDADFEQSLDGVVWEASAAPSPFNVGNAHVISDPGMLAQLPFALRTDAGRVLVLALAATCTYIGGCITIYERLDGPPTPP